MSKFNIIQHTMTKNIDIHGTFIKLAIHNITYYR